MTVGGMRTKTLMAMTMTLTMATGLKAETPVEIVRIETVPGAATSCPNSPETAERYVLSDGRSILRCGAPTADPVGFLNGAHVEGLTVSGLAAGVTVAQPQAGTPSEAATVPAEPAPVAEPAAPAPEPVPVEEPAATEPAATEPAVADSAAPEPAPAAPAETAPEASEQPAAADVAAEDPVAPEPAAPEPAASEPAAPQAAPPEAGSPQAALSADPTADTTSGAPQIEVPAPADAEAPAGAGEAPAPVLPKARPDEVGKSPRTGDARPAPKRHEAGKGDAPVGRCADASRCYVQLGAFGSAANVERARSALHALRMPVATQKLHLRNGGELTAVLAGPFEAARAEKALAAIRGCGFGAAMLR